MSKNVAAKSWTYHEWSDGTSRSWEEPEESFPSWHPSSAGVIVELDSGTTIGSAARSDDADDYPSNGDSDDLAAPYSGAAIVNVSGHPYLVVKGGGHNDGSYNGMVKFGPLDGDSPAWSIFLAGSGVANVTTTGVYSDGRQAACHTYNSICGVDDELYAMGTFAYYDDGDTLTDAYKFTPAGQTTIADNPVSAAIYGAVAHYDGKIYYVGGASQFESQYVYDIATDTWDSLGDDDIAHGNYVSAAIDTSRGGLLAIGSTSGGASAGTYWRTPGSTTGRLTGLTAPAGYDNSLIYDADRDKFVSLVPGTLTVRELDAATLFAGTEPSWTTRTFTGDTPDDGGANGTFGRFAYVPSLKGYFNVPTSESSVYFYRSA